MTGIDRKVFSGLSIAIETVRIDEELMEIWPNEVCDKSIMAKILGRSTGNHYGTIY